MMKTAKLIISVRKKLGLTQKELAGLLGTSRSNIANYETRVMPPGNIILRIIELQKVSSKTPDLIE
jgi:transcriptional regulator with XRE-family HTH domain